jgi:hypothetical protein
MLLFMEPRCVVLAARWLHLFMPPLPHLSMLPLRFMLRHRPLCMRLPRFMHRLRFMPRHLTFTALAYSIMAVVMAVALVMAAVLDTVLDMAVMALIFANPRK